MSVLIKGMEMPNEGAERCIVIRGDGTIRTFTGALIDYSTAIPVPPHGRLIDADVLIGQILNKPALTPYQLALKIMINSMPIIIPAEEGE